MEFQTGDLVVHEVYGVGKVVGIEDLRWVEDESSKFYVVMVGESKIWVPIEISGESHLRPITPKEELPSYRKIFGKRPAILEENRYGRTVYLSENQKHPSFRELCITVRDLTAHSAKKKLAKNESNFLERLTGQLIEEWALSAQIPIQQAETEVMNLLQDDKAEAQLGIEDSQ